VELPAPWRFPGRRRRRRRRQRLRLRPYPPEGVPGVFGPCWAEAVGLLVGCHGR
jgi:hypothetical protein